MVDEARDTVSQRHTYQSDMAVPDGAQENAVTSIPPSQSENRTNDTALAGDHTTVSSNGLEHHNGQDTASHPADGEYQLKYFPGVPAGGLFCVMCASYGHTAGSCPAMTCRFCQDQRHPSYGCPTRRRCTKCKQLGHIKADCQEKLALPVDEVECAICAGRGHTEAVCDELWRSFDPADLASIEKVNYLPVFCYRCGNEGHYGPECGLNRSGFKVSRLETWSQANAKPYQDPNASRAPIAFEISAGAYAETRVADEMFRIAGRSIVPQTHVFFEAEDEDEDEGFLHAPVEKRPRPGRITFAGNAASGNQRANGWAPPPPPPQMNLPPLPRGPPPPLPPSRPQGQGGPPYRGKRVRPKRGRGGR
jgi:protein AIR1/2